MVVLQRAHSAIVIVIVQKDILENFVKLNPNVLFVKTGAFLQIVDVTATMDSLVRNANYVTKDLVLITGNANNVYTPK
tara:strand:- start:474 stop:707 length:234 start_codon:yes stop_codon:yes gene_type:complete